MENKTENKTLTQAQEIINRHIAWAVVSGAFPVPFIDSVAVMFIQNDMIKQLSKIYGYEYNQNIGKSIVASIITSSSAKGLSMLFKKFKGADIIVMSVLSGAFTYAIGKLILNNFEKGMSLIDIDLKKGEELFSEFFTQGKEILKRTTTKKRNKKNPKNNKI